MDRFKLMETFVAVVQEGSYTRAARKLGVTRAMISRRVQDLEAHLGANLLHRDPHGVKVSSVGADYFENCLGVLSQVLSAEEDARSEVVTPRGNLKIIATKTLGESLMAPLFADFCANYPDIKVQISLSDGRPDLNEIDYDVAIVALPTSDATLTVRSIIDMPRVLVASPEYVKDHGLPATPKELSDHNCLDPVGAEWAIWRFRGKNREMRVRISGNPRCNTSTLTRHAALRGVGIAIISEYLVLKDIRENALVRILPNYELDRRPLCAVFPTDSRQPLRVRLFVDFLAENLKRLPGSSRVAHPIL